MKLNDCLLMLFIISIGCVVTDINLREFRQLSELSYTSSAKTNSLKFISSSFIQTCNGNGFESFVEWQKQCKALWKLEYIGWSKADNFLTSDNSENGDLYYGKWKSDLGEWEVYCRGANGKKDAESGN